MRQFTDLESGLLEGIEEMAKFCEQASKLAEVLEKSAKELRTEVAKIRTICDHAMRETR